MLLCGVVVLLLFFFFKQKTAYEMRISDWSSDVCSSDLGLALALDVQAQLRPDLRIVVMSATLDGERLAVFRDAPRLSSAGRSFAVQIAHFPTRSSEERRVGKGCVRTCRSRWSPYH